MFALLEIARIYNALKRFAFLQGPICYNDAQNKEMNLLLDIIRVKFAYHFRINYDLNLEKLNFSNWVFAILVKLCSAQGTIAHYV